MVRRIIVCILAIILISTAPIRAAGNNVRKKVTDNVSFPLQNDINDFPPSLLYKIILDESGNISEVNFTRFDTNDNPPVVSNDPGNIKITLTPPWDYEIQKDGNSWGNAGYSDESTEINGEYGKTTIHAWASWLGASEFTIGFSFYEGFRPPKGSNYLFTFEFYQEGRINLKTEFVYPGFISIAASRVFFYFYLWDGKAIFFERLMSVIENSASGMVGDGIYPYHDTRSYSSTAFLEKDTLYTFGAAGISDVFCEAGGLVSGSADQSVTKSCLKKVIIEWPNSPPDVPKLIYPGDGATGVSNSPTLKWSCSDPDGRYDTLKYDVYFGKSTSPPLVSRDYTSTSYSPGKLDEETTYYWKIVAKDSVGSTTSSPVWRFTTEKEGCCFPAGTKITMADGTYKNIENIRIGDKVLSYDVINGRFTTWRVKMLGRPIHPIISINNGLIQATVDHLFYVKKANGETGWAAYDIERAKRYNRFKDNLLLIEVGDKLYTSDEKWIEITNIEYNPQPVQTYNILSFIGSRTYFANGILVHEEHPPYKPFKPFSSLFHKIFIQ